MPTGPDTAERRAPRAGAWRRWLIVTTVLAGIVTLPLVAVVWNVFTPRADVWAHLAQTRLWALMGGTVSLLVAVGAMVAVLGIGLGWLVATHRFPGRGFFEWALVLPLAMPAYVIGFTFISVFDYGGPAASLAGAAFGSAAWLPEPRSFGALAVVMALVHYPYVYLLARAAFRDRSTQYLDAARSLGLRPIAAFRRLALPLARPAIAAGLALALMETLADFGTVSIFNHSTLTVAVYRVWFGMFDRVAAGQLATVLLLFAAGLIALERWGRGGARFAPSGSSAFASPRELRGHSRWMATTVCAAVFTLAFALPTLVLVGWSVPALGDADVMGRFLPQARNSAIAAGAATVVCVAAALALAYAARLARRAFLDRLSHVALLGYAIPGSVIAVGVLGVLAVVDRATGATAAALGAGTPPLLVTSAAGLLFAYVVRFLAVAYLPIRAGLDRIAPSIDETARVLGASPMRQAVEVHGPLLWMSVLGAALLVFVDTMKEMPATMLIRPFGFDTLAVGVWQATTESLWVYAAPPSLAMVVVGSVVLVAVGRLARFHVPLGGTL
ncbi:MAG: iron ABC transporter permease [Gemmatimonadaceae bacterium]